MRLGTFNVENLFTRYRFARGVEADYAAQNGFSSEQLRRRIDDPEAKRLTAEVMLAGAADVWALQEVEDALVLKRFRDVHLGGQSVFPHAFCIEGNDDRGIDVALLSRFPVVHLRSWQHVTDDLGRVFSRDLLEADVDVPGLGVLTLYVAHNKSMRADVPGDGRQLTRLVRVRQCRKIMDIVRQRFGPNPGDAAFVVLGDLNDYPEHDEQGESSLDELLAWDAIVDIGARRPPAERWTHHFKGSPRDNLRAKYRRLDWMLASRALAARNPHAPTLERRGMPWRASEYVGPRFAGVGHDRPKASDHCAMVWEISG